MASLYKRARSPFWWIKFRDTAGSIRRESTHFRHGRGDDLRRARQLEAEKTVAEMNSASSKGSRFDAWVDEWREARYANLNSRSRMGNEWKTLRAYLHEIGVHSPEQLRREHCMEFVPWREKQGHGNSPDGRKISRNTVILALKHLGTIMQEAVRRGYVQANPAVRLGLQRGPVKEKSEMTDEHVEIIRKEIARRIAKARTNEGRGQAQFLRVSFEIALHQGCRMAETWLHLSNDINLESMELRLKAKGGKDYYPPLNPALVPLIQELRKQGLIHTYTRPPMPTLVWFKVFKKLRQQHAGLADVSFHSTRVRAVSRLAVAGVPESVVMKLVNHASTSVHRIYRRVKRAEMDGHWDALAPKVSD